MPTTGNLNNYVDAASGGLGTVTWARLDVPWVVDSFAHTGNHVQIEPGAVIQFTPGSSLATGSTDIWLARGRPDAPILFQRRVPGADWGQLTFAHNITGSRLEYCIVEGAAAGVHADDAFVQVDRCILWDNQIGVLGTTYGTTQARGSRFLNNQVGARTTPLGSVVLTGGPNPNSFEGNSIGLEGNSSGVSATGNLWGHSSGPQHSSNPSGQGDLVTGSATAYGPRIAPTSNQGGDRFCAEGWSNRRVESCRQMEPATPQVGSVAAGSRDRGDHRTRSMATSSRV